MKYKSRSLSVLWVILIAIISLLATTLPAQALPPDPIDTDPIGEVPFHPPDNGFDWSVPSRFGGDSDQDHRVDFHWIQDGLYDPNGYYDPAYINPANFPVDLDGCRTEVEESSGVSENTYHWRFLYPGEAEDAPGQIVQGNQCRITQNFPAEETYRVRLTIRRPDNSVVLDEQGRGDPFMQDIVVKDYLIISIGDSFASGEGNPDWPGSLSYFPYPIPGGYWVSSHPIWQDARCGRSVWSGPAQAALAIEGSDRHTSVTFLSFACSGATIDTPFWKGNDANKYLGVGILRPYRGSEAPDDFSYEESTFIPSQIDQIRAAVNDQAIDALIISGGGNDIRFGTVAENCVLAANCWINSSGSEYPGDNVYVLHELVDRAVDALPAKFALLADALTDFNINDIYITEYPDLTSSDTPNASNEIDRYCNLVWDIIPGFEMSRAETKTAVELALNPLNQAVANAAVTHGWVLVDGIAEEFRQDANGRGHGYCASDAWIRSATDAFFMQGPFVYDVYPYPLLAHKKNTKGTLHPTARGHQVYAQRLREEILPRLNPDLANSPPPVFTSSLTNGVSYSRQGLNGWLIGRCTGPMCSSDQAVLTVEAAAQAAGTVLRGAKVTINGVDGCNNVPGISCLTTTSTGQATYGWAFVITETGVYRIQFLAKDSNLQVSTFAYEVRVDLDDPIMEPVFTPAGPNGSGWYTSPVTVTLAGSDPYGLSGLAAIEYNLDGIAGMATAGTTLTISDNGTHTLSLQAVDAAGRRGAQQTQTFQIDLTPPITTAAFNAGGSSYIPGSWTNQDILADLTTADNEGGSGVAMLVYGASGAQTIIQNITEFGQIHLNIVEEGETTLTFYAEDMVGNSETAQSSVLRIDRTPPTYTCAAADSVWHAADVTIACSASDSGAGFGNGPNASFTLTTNVPDGVETANASTNSHEVCDLAGNCTTVPAVNGIKVDKKAPEIFISAPINFAYTLNQMVQSDYMCTDNGAGLAGCAAPVTSGNPIDTSAVGEHSYQVSATDQVGNTSTSIVQYQVSYQICLLYDPAKAYKKNSTVPLRLQLCDVANADQSAGEIIVNALGLTKVDNTASGTLADAGNSSPDNNFRFDAALPGYIYNLSTKSLSTGTWELRFTVTGDPLIHKLFFDLK